MDTSIIPAEVVTLVAQAGLALFSALLTALVATGINLIRTKVSAEQFAFLQHAAAVAVSAAEQLGATDAIADKKGYAVDAVQKALDAKGIKVSASAVETAIEAAIMDGFNIDRGDTSVTADIVPAQAG